MPSRLGRVILLASLLGGAPYAIVAQAPATTGKVVGRIIDAAQGTPIAGATVELVGAPSPKSTTTNLDGRFTFSDLPAGEIGLRARMIGYGAKLVTGVRIPAGGAVTQDISLNAETVQLE